MTYCATAVTALALSVATHRTQPFLYTLLLVALLCEIQRMLGHARLMWFTVALVTDSAISGVSFIYSGPENARAIYPKLNSLALVLPAILLFAIYGTSVAVRVVFGGYKITVPETIQAMIAFLLLVSSVFYLAPQLGSATIGVLSLILAAAGYLASFRYLRGSSEERNFQVFSMWSAILAAAGILWTFPQAEAVPILAISALGAYAVATRISLCLLELHGATFLVTAAMISALPQYVFGALAGAIHSSPALPVFVVAGCATATYAFANDGPSAQWTQQLLCLIPALVATCGFTALLIRGLVTVTALAVALNVNHVAFLRTLVISAMSLCLAFVGSRSGRVAIKRLAYVALLFMGAKLLFEDLRYGQMEFIAGSIFLFAITLISVPRLVRAGSGMESDSSMANIPPK